jgi:putative redox protein
MKAKVKWQNKVQFESEVGSGHKIVMDGAPELGGENKWARPTELLLSGLGGCTGIGIINVLTKMRQEISDFTIHLDGTRAEDLSKRFTDIHVHYEFQGPNINPEKVKKAIQMSIEKYCSVSLSLNANITYSYEINGVKYNSN